MDILHTACFTGHRPQHLGIRENEEAFTALINDLEYELLELIHFKSVNTFISGMALGIDMYAARLVLEMKKRGEQIRLVCAIPCKNQFQSWGIDTQACGQNNMSAGVLYAGLYAKAQRIYGEQLILRYRGMEREAGWHIQYVKIRKVLTKEYNPHRPGRLYRSIKPYIRTAQPTADKDNI